MSELEKIRPIRLMIVGAQKAGTTSLLRYLGDHPGICSHNQVDMTYFVIDVEYQQGYDKVFPRYFACDEMEPSVVIAKSVAIMLLPEAINRLCAHNPHAQIVVVLRNPVDRAYSHYWYSRRRGWEDQETFEAALELDPDTFANNMTGRVNRTYLANGLYADHINQLAAYFPRDQIHVVLLKELKEDPVGVCKNLYGLFDELDSTFSPDTDRSHNTSAAYRFRSIALLTSSRSTLPNIKKMARRVIPDRTLDYIRDLAKNANEQDFTPPPMNLETRARLLDFYKPHNQRLSELIDRDLGHWNI
jgi:hypothetical protein